MVVRGELVVLWAIVIAVGVVVMFLGVSLIVV